MNDPFTVTKRVLFAFFLSAVAFNSGIRAQTPGQDKTEFQYAAKFVCGVCGKPEAGLAAQGEYFTIINVHNPSPNTVVEFRKRFALALPGEKAGKVSPFFPAALQANEAMGMDCPNIYEHTQTAPGTFIEGYALIHSPVELDVVSVYTAGSPVTTLHTERVPPRRVPLPCGNLSHNLSTGTAAWDITKDPFPKTTEPRPASIVTSPPSGWGSISGAKWIGPNPAAEGFGVVGDFTYQTCFCLCPGFTNARLTFKGLVDESATISLNGTPLSPTLGSFSSPTSVQTNDQQLFKAGNNCLTVVVHNTTTQTGLNLAGTVTATAGQCP